jgi:nitrite reductase (NADH) small subunit
MKTRICASVELPDGAMRFTRTMARTVIVIRLDGRLHGLEGNCKHMKASLAAGSIEGVIITCPMHGWQYDIVTGECLNESWAVLRKYNAWEESGQVYVDI